MIDHWQILEKVTENPHLCPHCDSVLILKEGSKGKFLACPNFPECQYTKSLALYRSSSGHPYCEKCKGEQKLPLINKKGKIVPYAWVFCECRIEPEYYPSLKPSDFDFPVSFSFYRSLCQEHGWPDPGSDYPVEDKPQVIEHIHRHIHYNSSLSQKEHDDMEQIKRKSIYIDKKLSYFDKSKRYNKYTI